MIPFEGRSSLKQYISLKPVKQGFKVWVRVDSLNGYFCEFEVYTGKADTTAEHNLSERVVHKLTRSISGLNHQVFCDRFFTCFLPYSSERCVPMEPTSPHADIFLLISVGYTLIEKQQFLFRQTGNIVAAVWMDKKIVSALSTMSDPDISNL